MVSDWLHGTRQIRMAMTEARQLSQPATSKISHIDKIRALYKFSMYYDINCLSAGYLQPTDHFFHPCLRLE
jgi:hypothetical protein